MQKPIESPPLHLTARSNNQEWFNIPMKTCWEIFCESLNEVEKRYGFLTHVFLLMNNHYHWIASIPDEYRSKGMCLFQTTTSRQIARSANRINRIYGARYKPTLIKDPVHYQRAIQYVYQNPIRANICRYVQDYPWSTLNSSLVKIHPCEHYDALVPETDYLKWLNSVPDENYNGRTRKALRRRMFLLPRAEDKFRREK